MASYPLFFANRNVGSSKDLNFPFKQKIAFRSLLRPNGWASCPVLLAPQRTTSTRPTGLSNSFRGAVSCAQTWYKVEAPNPFSLLRPAAVNSSTYSLQASAGQTRSRPEGRSPPGSHGASRGPPLKCPPPVQRPATSIPHGLSPGLSRPKALHPVVKKLTRQPKCQHGTPLPKRPHTGRRATGEHAARTLSRPQQTKSAPNQRKGASQAATGQAGDPRLKAPTCQWPPTGCGEENCLTNSTTTALRGLPKPGGSVEIEDGRPSGSSGRREAARR